MTPQQKAMELVQKGCNLLRGNFNITDTAKDFARMVSVECESICLNEGEYNGKMQIVGGQRYWQLVRKEIDHIGVTA